jgi:hypothetical protein
MFDSKSVTLRYSLLKQMGISPRHFRSAAMNQGDDSTSSQHRGTLSHAVAFGQPYAVFEGTRRGKEWEEFKAANSDRPIATVKEAAEAVAIADALRSDKTASALLFEPGMVYEERIDWEWRGRKFRSTPDAIGNGRIVDLKTTRCADPEWFRRDAIRYGYHAQLAFYQEAAHAIGVVCNELYIVAVEAKEPYCVTTMRLTPTTTAIGMQSCIAWFDRIAECEMYGDWPGYASGVVDLHMDMGDADGVLLEEGNGADL